MAMKLLMLVIFFAIMVSVGIYARKHATSVDGYVLGGRSVGPWLTAFAYGTSYFSAVVFVGYAGQFGWKYGLASTWIGIGNAIIGSLLAWVVLGRRTKVMTQHLNSKTMPDFFGERYGSKALKITASAIVFIFLVPYTASVYNGLSRLFGMAFNIPYKYCVIGMAVFTGIYVILGGYMATAINDFIQGIIMLGGIVAVILAVLNGQGGFIQAIKTMAEIPSDVPVTMGQPGAFTSFFGPDPLNLLGVVILTSLGTWGLPQMVGKFYAIKDEKSINTGTVISTLFAIVISGGCYFLGGFGRLFDAPELHDEAGNMIFDGIIPHMLSTLPDILIGIEQLRRIIAALVLQCDNFLCTHTKDKCVFFANFFNDLNVCSIHGCVLYCIIGSDRNGSAYIHRTADGNFLGSTCRSVPGTIHVWPLLERRDKSRCMGQLCGRCRDYGSESVLPLYCITDQCRSSCNGSRTDRSTGSECAYTKA